MKKAVLALIVTMLITGLTWTAIAQTEHIGPLSEHFDDWQYYPHHALAIIRLDTYYDQAVWVHYVATNRWNMIRKETEDPKVWWVKISLVQNGTAEVWNANRTQKLDTQPFMANEVTMGTVKYLANWYHRNKFSYVEMWKYHWHIGGIYHYKGTCKDGLENAHVEYWVKGYGTEVLK